MTTLRRLVKRAIPAHYLKSAGKAYSLATLAREEMLACVAGPFRASKPTAVSLMANDICNSRCEMCLIWKQKRDYEITADALQNAISDSFFAEVSHVGVTGGEPTLRKDLPELFEAICSTLPKLRTTSIITNGIREKAVKERVLACAEISKKHRAEFSVMVSLDGLGEVHDRVRGVGGNFESAIDCLEHFRAQGLTTSFGCTVTESNAPYVDELLDWAIENRIYGRFRVADYIDRLYNTGVLNVIRAFDGLTSYHLGLFFFRLESSYETNPVAQKTYRNVRGMIAEGKSRQIGCAHHDKAVVLTSRGELLFCSPKSPNLGSVLAQPASKVYFSNISKRREMIEKDCGNCIHDYPAPITFSEKWAFWREHRRRGRAYDGQRLTTEAGTITEGQDKGTDGAQRILIVGWYGTETVGDKAILWSVIERLRRRAIPPTTIQIASLYPFVTKWTVGEMKLGPVEVVETYSEEFERACAAADEVVIGGGPLMDLEALNHMLFAFNRVRRKGGIARIEGCGIGPLKNPAYVEIVRQLVRLASVVTVRDQPSAERCAKEFGIRRVEVVPDPAVEFVETMIDRIPAPATYEPAYAACFLREWSSEYAAGRTEKEFEIVRGSFERNLSAALAHLASKQRLRVKMLPMHCFSVGGDDRKFARRFARQIEPLLQSEPVGRIEVPRLPVSPAEIARQMKHATLNICMRFHSVVFAETLGAPFVAIDYTGGGKIRAFLAERGKLNRLLTVEELAELPNGSASLKLLNFAGAAENDMAEIGRHQH